MFVTIAVFVFILGLLIFVHELGHFIVAKKTGVKVDEFAFGFPPRIFAKRYRGTLYAINLIPLGGYVKLLGEEEETESPASFHRQPVWVRLAIVVTGVLMNFVLAIVLMTIGFSVGMTPLVSDPAAFGGQKTSQVMVVFVQPNSPADQAGIKTGHILHGFVSASDLQQFTRSHINQEVDLKIQKNHRAESLKIKLSDQKDAPLGVGVVSVTKVKQPVGQAFISSIKETGRAIKTLFSFLGDIFKNIFTTGRPGAQAEGVVGPVGLFNFTAQAINIGWIYVLQLVIILSINLGIINILPFPALDGGKMLFLILEGAFRRKIVRQEIENAIHLIGFVLLILLFVAITFRDVRNFF